MADHPDSDQYMKDVEAEIVASGDSQEQLLEQKWILWELRLALPRYKQF